MFMIISVVGTTQTRNLDTQNKKNEVLVYNFESKYEIYVFCIQLSVRKHASIYVTCKYKCDQDKLSINRIMLKFLKKITILISIYILFKKKTNLTTLFFFFFYFL